jgi:HSP20 family protein
MPEFPVKKRLIVQLQTSGSAPEWQPRADVYRTQQGWLLKFDLAGVHAEDVSVRVQGCRITVSGTRRDWSLEDGNTHYSMEIAYNRFERTIDLPCTFREPEVAMQFREGILLVRVNER